MSGGEAWSTGVATLADRVVAQARPGEQLEVVVGRSRRVVVKAYGAEIESITSADTAAIGVRVLVEGRQGLARAGSLADDVIADVLEDARSNVPYAQPDPFAGLAEPDGVAPVALDVWADELDAVQPDQRAGWALELERRVCDADPRITGVRSATYGEAHSAWAIASTAGVRAASAGTGCSAGVTALATDGGETQVGSASQVGRHPGELDLGWITAEAAERATRLLGARPVPSGRMAVVLDARVAASVLGITAGMLSGERVLKGRSPFAERLGSAIASPVLTFHDDATDARSDAADPFDGEGLATRRVPLVEAGVLSSFLHNAYTARRAGTASTGSAVRGYGSAPGVASLALAVSPGEASLDELVAKVGDGLLVFGVSGLHSGVNSVSGDFSVGAEGVRIRDGERAEPVREITIASTIPRLLLDIADVGGELTWLPGGDAAAPLVVAELTVSGR